MPEFPGWGPAQIVHTEYEKPLACPHCRQPLAIISVVIPADAATVRPPEAPHTAHNSANLNPPPGEDDLATLGNFGERQQHLVTKDQDYAFARPGLGEADVGQ